ncbi:hypothetical protein ACJX0J_040904, partial [Zea mays]
THDVLTAPSIGPFDLLHVLDVQNLDDGAFGFAYVDARYNKLKSNLEASMGEPNIKVQIHGGQATCDGYEPLSISEIDVMYEVATHEVEFYRGVKQDETQNGILYLDSNIIILLCLCMFTFLFTNMLD